MTHWQCPGIPINYIQWADDAPGYPDQKGMPHSIEWGPFGKIIRLFAGRCGYCHKEQTGKDLEYAILVPTPDGESEDTKILICLDCQHKEMELAEIDTRQDDLRSQWMEEKYGYLRDEQ